MGKSIKILFFKIFILVPSILFNLIYLPLASAATFNVTNLNDTGGGSLRAAILSANTSSGFDEVVFDANLNGVISLTSEIIIDDIVEIVGPGADKVSVDGGNNSRIFFINDFNVKIQGLTLTRGKTPVNTSGGAIHHAGANSNLNLVDCAITESRADRHGGGIYTTGDVTLENCQLNRNQASTNANGYYGGGLFARNATLKGSEVSQNTTSERGGRGGGIYVSRSAMIMDSVISDNTTIGSNGRGGGVYANYGVTLDNSIISGNQSTSNGGGLYINSTDGLIINSAIYSNTANLGGGLLFGSISNYDLLIFNSTLSDNTAQNNGGALYQSSSGKVTVASSSIVDNTAGQNGGGFYFVASTNDRIKLQNSLFSENKLISGTGTAQDIFLADQLDLDGPEVKNNFISDDATTGLVDTVNGNIIGNTTSQVGALADNGGMTLSHAPLTNSQILNAGNNQLLTQLAQDFPGLPDTFDQRGNGFPRILETTVDIGSIEGVVTPPSNNILIDNFE